MRTRGTEYLTIRGAVVLTVATGGPWTVPDLAHKLNRSEQRIRTVLWHLRRRGIVRLERTGRHVTWHMARGSGGSRAIDPIHLFTMEVRNARQSAQK